MSDDFDSLLSGLSVNENKLPAFRLAFIPSCRHCDTTPDSIRTVSARSTNGNAGRQYFLCEPCDDKNGDGWIAWNDAIGIDLRNPPCYCSDGTIVSRQGKINKRGPSCGKGNWTCATGQCGYYSERKDGLTPLEARKKGLPRSDGFEPHLLR